MLSLSLEQKTLHFKINYSYLPQNMFKMFLVEMHCHRKSLAVLDCSLHVQRTAKDCQGLFMICLTILGYCTSELGSMYRSVVIIILLDAYVLWINIVCTDALQMLMNVLCRVTCVQMAAVRTTWAATNVSVTRAISPTDRRQVVLVSAQCVKCFCDTGYKSNKQKISCVCMRACVRACVRACMCVYDPDCMRTCVI